ncbi:hypothetical protein IWW50_006699, partial [Coemansia erecta]
MMIKILQCIAHIPISTRNTIDESRLEEAVKPLCSYSDENVSSLASTLVERWSSLRHVFKIPKKSKKESATATATPAASTRQSPSQTGAATPQALGVESRDAGGSESPKLTRWRNSPAPQPSRIRSESPMEQDSDIFQRQNQQHQNHSQQPRLGNTGWGRRGGFRGQSPGGSMQANRSPGRPPYPGYRQRYAHNMSRSRSPRGFHRPMSIRFPRNSADEYRAPSQQPSGFGPSEPTDRGSSPMPFSTLPARGRYARWGEHGSQQRMSGEGEKPYAMEANPDRRRQPYTRADNARYENSRPADDTPRLAPGWRTAYTGDGIPYYYHEATKETRWEPPVADQPPKGGNRYADLGVNSPGARDGHFSRRKADGRDARVYSAA